MALKKSLMVVSAVLIAWTFMSLSLLSIALASNPEINVTGVLDNAHYNMDVTPAIELLGDYQNPIMTLNGAPFVSGTTVTEEGSYTLSVAVEDLTGTPYERTVNFTIDKAVPIVALGNLQNGDHIKGIFQIQANIVEPNISTTSVKIDGIEIGTSLPYVFDTSNYIDGVYTISVETTDNAGNSSASSASITIDNTKPSGTIVTNRNSRYSKSPTVRLRLAAADNLELYQMRLKNAGGTWSDWMDHQLFKKWTLPKGNGDRSVYAQFKDRAGNRSYVMKDTIILDTKKPSGAIVLNNGAIYTNKTGVQLNLKSSDNYGVALMRIRNSNDTWSRWLSRSTLRRGWLLAGTQGLNKVYVQFKDKAGNVSSTTADTIFVDNKAPGARISAPASIVTALPSYPLSVWWTGYDSTPSSGISSYEVQYKRSTDIYWSSWLPRASAGAGSFATLPGATYIFRARSIDKAGNVGTWSAEARTTVSDYYGQFINEPTIVLSRSQQRVRIYNANGALLKTFLVSTGKYAPAPGTYRVYSKSPQSMSVRRTVYMKHMVRFTRASTGVAIGFHSVIYRKDGTVIDREKLGQPVSAGCVRSDFPNAEFIYNFAPIGTKVWVVK